MVDLTWPIVLVSVCGALFVGVLVLIVCLVRRKAAFYDVEEAAEEQEQLFGKSFADPLESERVTEEDATAQASNYIRSFADLKFQKSCLQIGRRLNKCQFIVSFKGQTCIMTMTPASPEVQAVLNRCEPAVWAELVGKIAHPYIAPTLHCGLTHVRRQSVLVIPMYNKRGSLRDYIHRANPTNAYRKKYTSGRSLQEREMRVFARDILEALIYLESATIPFPHLHCGNVMVDQRGGSLCALLSDIDLGLLGLAPEPPRKKSDRAALQLGAVIFEMATGSILVGSPNMSELSRDVQEVLDVLLQSDHPASLLSLRAHPFFDVDVEPSETPLKLAGDARLLLKQIRKAAGFSKKTAVAAAPSRAKRVPSSSGKKRSSPAVASSAPAGFARDDRPGPSGAAAPAPRAQPPRNGPPAPPPPPPPAAASSSSSSRAASASVSGARPAFLADIERIRKE